MAHIYGHTWPVRWGKPGESRTAKVIASCPTAELFLNGQSLAVRRRNSQKFSAAGFRWQVPFAAGENRLRVLELCNGRAGITLLESSGSSTDVVGTEESFLSQAFCTV